MTAAQGSVGGWTTGGCLPLIELRYTLLPGKQWLPTTPASHIVSIHRFSPRRFFPPLLCPAGEALTDKIRVIMPAVYTSPACTRRATREHAREHTFATWVYLEKCYEYADTNRRRVHDLELFPGALGNDVACVRALILHG